MSVGADEAAVGMILPFPNAYGRAESRRYQRVNLSLAGRYMLTSRKEFPCRTIDISPGGMFLAGPVKPAFGENVVVYMDALGRFSGKTVRVVQDGFAVALDMSSRKRETLADQLTWFANRKALSVPEDRRHERFVPLMSRAILRLANGQEAIVKIRDLSLSGFALETNCLPEPGTPIIVGSTPATVVRHFDGGFAGEFIAPFAEGEIDEMTRL
jgi:hypothetical protein